MFYQEEARQKEQEEEEKKKKEEEEKVFFAKDKLHYWIVIKIPPFNTQINLNLCTIF